MEQKNLLRQEDIINLPPQDRIQGFDVRPGFYEINGASAFPNGVNFTIISFGAVSCTLLLFHRRERTPYARLPFPAHYRVGNVFSMFVYGLEIDEFEYAKEAVHLEVEEYILKPVNSLELTNVFTQLKIKLDQEISEKRSAQILQKYYMESLPLLHHDG